MEFRILGAVEVLDGGRPLPVGGPKPRALLVRLLLDAGRAVSRARLIDELWGDQAPPTARDSLNVHAGLLRRALGPRLHTVADGYLLEAGAEEIDAARFEVQVNNARAQGGDPTTVSDAFRVALALWRGPVFGGLAVGPLAAAAGVRLEETRIAILEDRVEADLALGRHAELVAELAGAVAAAPTRERLAGQLMLALHRCGRSADALMVYATTCRRLDEELGVDPGDALVALNAAVHRDDPTLAGPGPASLPVATSRFVGRGEEVARVGELLIGTRLLTLTGVGGCGKTRLALELARRAASDHPDGTHFVDLAPLAPGALVSRHVAAALGVRERRGTPLLALLSARLRHGRTLLLLDNCEHLAQDCAELCAGLLEAAPGLRVLATSREPLGVGGEVVFSIAGLALPPPGADDAAVLRADAVRLLLDRAAAAHPGFTVRPEELTVAAALCRHLDGLPLAIELAAARLRTLSLAEVLQRLDERLDALGSWRAVHARHRTMRAAIEWSHDLLDDDERVVLRRLAVFAGGFGAPGAAEVAGCWQPLATSDPDIVDICGRLADKSMLIIESSSEGTGYRMLETVRQYAAERLAAAGEQTQARARHAAWYQSYLPEAARWSGPEQRLWMARLAREIGNVRAALGWYLGEGWEPELALAMAGPLWSFWYMHGLVGEGRSWLERSLAATPRVPSRERGMALRAAAALARIMGDFGDAVRLGEEALSVFRAFGDDRGVAAALNNLCISALNGGDLDAARRHGEEGLRVIEGLGEQQGLAASRNSLGIVARNRGDLDGAEALFAAARSGFAGGGNSGGEAAALGNLAIVSRLRGDTAVAGRRARESLCLYAALGFDEGKLDCLELLAALASSDGDPELALRLLAVSARMREQLNAPLFVPDEIEQVTQAEARARNAVSSEHAAALLAASRLVPLDDVVASVL